MLNLSVNNLPVFDFQGLKLKNKNPIHPSILLYLRKMTIMKKSWFYTYLQIELEISQCTRIQNLADIICSVVDAIEV